MTKALPGKLGATVEMRVEVGDPHDQILRAGKTMDVIVMSTSGRTGLSHLLIGSVNGEGGPAQPGARAHAPARRLRRAAKIGAR